MRTGPNCFVVAVRRGVVVLDAIVFGPLAIALQALIGACDSAVTVAKDARYMWRMAKSNAWEWWS